MALNWRFTRKEVVGLLIIFGVFGAFFVSNLSVSIRRARDSQRKTDIRTIANALDSYQDDLGTLPLSSNDGKIIACDSGERDSKGRVILRACEWDQDPIADVTDPAYPPYLEKLPLDPHTASGASYYYLSNGNTYQLFASLEGMDEAEYDPAITARNLACGVRTCNFGLGYSNTPLDKSIEDWENERRKIKGIWTLPDVDLR